eukprot:355089-Prymnesium_polylepis.2
MDDPAKPRIKTPVVWDVDVPVADSHVYVHPDGAKTSSKNIFTVSLCRSDNGFENCQSSSQLRTNLR